MGKRVGWTIFVVLLAILAFEGPAVGLTVSSQIDLDSQEAGPSATDSGSKAFANANEVGTPQTSRAPAFRAQGAAFTRTVDSKKRRSHFARDDPTKPPTIINNIQIVVNGNETEAGESSCKNGVCDVSVSSRPDGEGNIITEVRLSIVTKLSSSPQVGDIPVVDGVRGVGPMYEGPPDVHPLSRPQQRPLLYNNIPQIQTRLEPNDPWYGGRRPFRRPESSWGYRRPGMGLDRGFHGQGGWMPSKPPVVDDKIEPPLSKTQPSED